MKEFPLGGLYVSFYLIWGKCRCRNLVLSDKFKRERGLLGFEISGLSQSDYLMKLVWFVQSALIFSLLAPLFRRMRATFSQFESGLKISPPSGKTVIDLFDDLYTYFEAREAPLSALRATLPEGEGGVLFRRVGTLFAFGFKCRSEKFF